MISAACCAITYATALQQVVRICHRALPKTCRAAHSGYAQQRAKERHWDLQHGYLMYRIRVSSGPQPHSSVVVACYKFPPRLIQGIVINAKDRIAQNEAYGKWYWSCFWWSSWYRLLMCNRVREALLLLKWRMSIAWIKHASSTNIPNDSFRGP